MSKPWENQSGCKDPTAYEATRAISIEEERVSELIRVLKYIIKHAGFELVNRIELHDRKSGRIYR